MYLCIDVISIIAEYADQYAVFSMKLCDKYCYNNINYYSFKLPRRFKSWDQLKYIKILDASKNLNDDLYEKIAQMNLIKLTINYDINLTLPPNLTYLNFTNTSWIRLDLLENTKLTHLVIDSDRVRDIKNVENQLKYLMITNVHFNLDNLDNLQLSNIESLHIPYGTHTRGIKNMARFAEKLKELSIQYDIDNINQFKNLTKLYLRRCDSIRDLNSLIKLKCLELFKCSNICNDGIKSLINIERLIVCDDDDVKITDINHMTKLRYLRIDKCKHLHFDKCVNITELIINSSEPISLNHMKNLTKLDIRSSFTNENIKDLYHVESLILRDNININDVNHMHKLKVLILYGNNIFDNDSFKYCVDIEELNIENNKYITNINHLTKLRKLNASNSQLTDDGIKECKNIVNLRIESKTYITDISHLYKLRKLYTSHNDNINNEMLKPLVNLQKLSVNYCKNVTDINHLTDLYWLKACGKCGLGKDGISNLDLKYTDYCFNELMY